jgi:hypothetical protein
LPLQISGSCQVSDETVGIIEDEDIRGLSGKFCHKRARACLCG